MRKLYPFSSSLPLCAFYIIPSARYLDTWIEVICYPYLQLRFIDFIYWNKVDGVNRPFSMLVKVVLVFNSQTSVSIA